MTKCVLIDELEVPQISHNIFSPFAQIGQSFGIFLKKLSSHVHCLWWCRLNFKLVGQNYADGIGILQDIFKISDINSKSPNMNLLKIVLTQIYQLARSYVEVVVWFEGFPDKNFVHLPNQLLYVLLNSPSQWKSKQSRI